MENIIIQKASSVTPGSLGDMQILFTGGPPKGIRLNDLEKFYNTEAETLADALERILPAGTLDRVIAKLLTNHASNLVFPRKETP